MENKPQSDRERDQKLNELLEQLLVEIVADPKVRMQMLINQPIDVQDN